MQNPRLNLLCLAYIPVVLAEVTAGAACNAHFAVILVAAVRAFPLVVVIYLNLAVKAAAGALVALCVELSVLNVIINKLNYLGQCREVVGYIRNFNIAYCAAA